MGTVTGATTRPGIPERVRRNWRALGLAACTLWSNMLLFSAPLLARPDELIFDTRVLTMLTSVLGFVLAFAAARGRGGERGRGGLGGQTSLMTSVAVAASLATAAHLLIGPAMPRWADCTAIAVYSVCFAFLLVGCGETYAHLEPFEALAFAGASYLLGWSCCSVVDALPRVASGVVTTLMPLAALATMPCWQAHHEEASEKDASRARLAAVRPLPGDARAPLATDLRLTLAALPPRLLAGLAVTHFSLGVTLMAAGRASSAGSFFSPASVGLATLTSLACLGLALALKRRVPLVSFYKAALVVQASGAFLLAEASGPAQLMTVVAFVGVYIMSWALVAQCAHAGLAVGALPALVIASGRLAEQAGEGLGMLLARSGWLDGIAVTALVGVLLLVAAAFLFTGTVGDGEALGASVADGRTMTTAGNGAMAAGEALKGAVGAGRSAPARPSIEERVAIVARRHRLSARETEVFELWATGHDLKYVQDKLGLSLSTVKTHVRHIYAKTDTHSRAEVVILLDEADDRGAGAGGDGE